MDQHVLLILSGGFGTRLKSVVSDVPKPLAPVNNNPFLYYLIKNWTAQGLKNFIFLLYNKADLIIEFLLSEKEGILKNCNFSWVVEPEPMGTGGAVVHCIQQLNLTGNILITNADTWIGSGMTEICNSIPPAMAVINVKDSGRYGSVQISENRIIAFQEKSSNTGEGWINTGLYHLNANIFKNVDEKTFSLEQVTFPELARSGKLKAVKLKADFIDIGIPDDYFRFIEFINSQVIPTNEN